MPDKLILRGPDDKEYPVGEGQALAWKEDADGNQSAEVVEVVEHEGSRAVISDEVRKLLHDQVDLVRQGTADQANLMKSLKDILELNAKTSRVQSDSYSTPRADSLDAKTYEDLIDTPATNDWAADVQRTHDKAYVRYQARCAMAVCRQSPMPRFENTPEGRAWRGVVRAGPWPMDDKTLGVAQQQFERSAMVTRAAGDTWDPDTAGQGDTWAPTGVSRQFIDVHRLRTSFVSAFTRVEIPRGVHRLDIPCLTGAATVSVVDPSTGAVAFPPQSGDAIVTPPTGVMHLQTKKHGTPPMAANMEEVEDATLAVVDVLVAEGFAALGKALESGVLNGQTTDDAALDVTFGPTPANGYATADGADPVGWGLRKYSIAGGFDVDAGAGAAVKDDILAMLRELGNFGVNDGSNQVAIAISPKVWFDLLGDSSLESMDIVGRLATLPTGALTQIYNAVIFVTDQIPNMLATGKVAAAANNFTGAQGVNLDRWKIGFARDAEVRILGAALADVIQLRHFARHTIGHAQPITDSSACFLRNVGA
jgi:hypothetical protein